MDIQIDWIHDRLMSVYEASNERLMNVWIECMSGPSNGCFMIV
jgi:hypothetical protein